MITKKQLDDILSLKGFVCVSFNTQRTCYTYVSSYTGICLIVYTDKNSFELIYHLDNTIFTLNSGECSPFYEETPQYKQFDKMYSKFYEIVLNLRRDS